MEITKSIWNGFTRLDFLFEGRDAILILPDDSNKCDKWLFKTEYFDAFPDLEIEMVKRGWHLAFIKNKTRWCLDEDLDLKSRFADFLSEEFGLYKKCVPVGMSCGGLIGTKFAAKYPEKVSCLYIDAPVLNLLSCPCGLGIGSRGISYDEYLNATGRTMSELICYREHPIDKMHILLENNLPIIMVAGDSDSVVPYVENGAILEKFYKENGGTIEIIIKPGCEHHPHGLEDNTPIIDFVLKHSN